MNIKRAFRFFGAFGYHEPDSSEHYNWAPKCRTKGNLLEIFYAQEAPGEQWRAFARMSVWKPGDLPEVPDLAPDPKLNIFNQELYECIYTALAKEDTVAFWICKPSVGSAKLGHRLRLLDCVAFDQFDQADPDDFSRFPLRKRYTYKGKKVGSVITFGTAPKGSALRVQVGFPTASGLGIPEATLSMLSLFRTTLPSSLSDQVAFVTPMLTDLTAPGFSASPGQEKPLPFGKLHFGPSISQSDARGKLSDATGGVDTSHEGFVTRLGLGAARSRVERMEFLGGKGLSSNKDAAEASPTYAIAHRTTLRNLNALPVLGSAQPSLSVSSAEFDVETIATCALSDETLQQATTGGGKEIPIKWQFHCALRWTTSQTLYKGKFPENGPDTSPLESGGLSEVAWVSQVARDGLVATTSQPQSILPELTFRGQSAKRIDVSLIAYAHTDLFVGGGPLGGFPTIALSEEREFDDRRPVPLVTTLDTRRRDGAINRHHAPANRMWQKAPDPKSELPFDLALPLFMDRATTTTPGTAFSVVLTHHPKAETDSAKPPKIWFGLRNGARAPEKPLSARLGALTFEGADVLLYHEPNKIITSSITLKKADRPHPDALPDAVRAPRVNMEIALDLALISAQPVTVDIAHGDRDERPNDLLIRETLGKPEGGPHLHLHLTERLRDDQDRHLVGELSDVTSEQADRQNIVILTDEPFSIYRYQRQPFEDVGDAASSAVAQYDSDHRQWRRKQANQTYLMMRPPGAIGEDADKPGVLELHDPVDQKDLCPALPPENGVPRRVALDMRFSPPSALWLRPTDLARNFVLPEYAARELFRQRGDFGLGVQLAGLQSEALYGLSLGILVPPPSREKPTPRVAEIETLVGRMVSGDKDQTTARSRRWKALSQAFRKRPEHLEIWTLDQTEQSPFVPTRFDAETSYALRQTALLAPPVGESDKLVPADQDGPLRSPRFAPHGLAGGVLWPFESANVIRDVTSRVVADGGELDRVSLSPMGISADQSVSFLDGRVKIISETREGRLHKQRVEVLGRIGALWHRAKHVVIFERTTAPSDQFAPAAPGSRSARAVLRKVREFVEILEPVRRYPDVPGTAPDTRGFVSSVRFNSKIINVNSAWGGDVGDHGWQVPLWNRGESEERPQVYPHPDVAFVTRSEGRETVSETAQECRDPHLLYFYTETGREVSTNSDLWPVREGIDCAIAGLNEIQVGEGTGFRDLVDAQEHPFVKDDLERREFKRRVASSRVPFGIRRFTWRLAPSPVRTQINAERGEKPIYAGLESVTFMRDFEMEVGLEVKDYTEITSTIDKALKVPELKPSLSLPHPVTENPKEAAPQLDALRDLIVAMQKEPNEGTADKVAKALAKFDSAAEIGNVAVHVLGSDPADKLKEVRNTLACNRLVESLNAFDGADCRRQAESAAKALQRRKVLLLQTIRQSETAALATIKAQGFKDKATIKRALKQEIVAEITGVTSDLGATIGSVADGVAVARAIIRDWRDDARAGLARAHARVDEAVNALDRVKPWSKNRLENALDQLDTVYDAAEREAEAALSEARQRLATEINGSARSVSGVIGATISSVLKARGDLSNTLSSVDAIVKKQAALINTALDKIPTTEDSRYIKMREKVSGSNNATLKSAFKAATKALEEVPDIQSKVAKAAHFATEKVADLGAEADKASKTAVAALKEADAIVTELEAFAKTALAEGFDDLEALSNEIKGALSEARDTVGDLAQETFARWAKLVDVLDVVVGDYAERVKAEIARVEKAANAGYAGLDQWFKRFEDVVRRAQLEVPREINAAVISQIVDPALKAAFDAVIWPAEADEAALKAATERAVRGATVEAEILLNKLDALATDKLKVASEACQAVAGVKKELFAEADKVYANYKAAFEKELQPALDNLRALVVDAQNAIKTGENIEETVAAVVRGVDDFSGAFDGVATEFASASEHARAYFTGGLERLGDVFDGKVSAAPGKALELISFLSHSPEIANIKTNADRARMYVDKAEKALNTPEIRATLDYLGDALKALGLEFDFEDITDEFALQLPKSGDLRSLIPSFGGIDLRDLLPSTSIGADFKKYVKLTHDLDTKAGRAWVQADVDAPLAGRQPLFTIGPFTLFVTRSQLTAFLRAEASKDSPEVTVVDKATLKTDLEAVVSGQVLVTLKDALITYSTETDLDFEIDPRKIRIHKGMQFVQDTFGSIFGSEDTGLSFLREGASIVGVQHKFSLPPMSLNYATSGISNIAIANRFSLRAYPDFVIANQFNLSRRELPFIFSIFIIGGTGYVQVDTEYRPSDSSLVVAVEAGLGGSAALAFSFGPVSGGVYITLSVVLRYAKRIGAPAQSDDGLSVSIVLVIAGNVSLWGMVTIYLGLMLSINYHESGRIDARGSLSVEVRISRWFKLKYSTGVTYKLRDGQSTVTRTEELSTSGKAKDAFDKLDKLNQARKSL